MINKRVKNMLYIVGFTLSSQLYADISGTVFRDLPVNGDVANTYGVKDSNELGVKGVTVTAYPGGATTTTDANGAWSLPTVGDVRVEFSNWPNYLQESPSGTVNNSSVRFARDGDVVNFGLHDPAEYSTTNPLMASIVMINGKTSSGLKTVVSFPYNSSGILTGSGTTYNGTELAKNSDVGSVWGLAYGRKTNVLYAASFLKRHTALKGNVGDIWKIDLANGNSSSLFCTISNAGTVQSNADRGVDVNTGDPSHDDDTYSKVGKVGLGGIAISTDEKYLYTVNLNDKKLYKIVIDADNDPSTSPAAEDISSVDIPDPGCTNGEWRPFALKYYHNEIYVGGVCDANEDGDVYHSENLTATVYRYNDSNFTNVLSFPLNYNKVSLYGETIDTTHRTSYWHTWATPADTTVNSSPEPLLSDIEFDIDGSMIIAFLDRYGHQIGHKNYIVNSNDVHSEATAGGDILRACLDNGNYVLESNGICNGVTGAGTDRTSGPADGEFYDDRFNKNSNTDGHSETSDGAVAILPGSGQVVLNSMDPVDWDGSGSDQDYFRAGGPAWYNNSGANAGKKTRGYHLFRHRDYNNVGWAKGTGVGDIELLSAPAPIEIGNRVWDDINGDGIQDEDEPGIDDITVQLFCADTKVAEAITKDGGYYIFSNDPNGTSTDNRIYNISELTAGRDDCKIVIPDYKNQTPLNEKMATKLNSGEKRDIDSNGVEVDNNSEANVAAEDIANPGDNNHTYDFGFKKADSCIGDYVWIDKNVNGLQDSGEVGEANVTVKLLKDGADFNTTITDANGKYEFCGLKAGTYQVVFDLNTLPAHYVVTTKDAGDDNNDSDADQTTGATAEVTFENDGDPDIFTIDMGIYKKPCLGDYVWLDENANGIQDDSESGVDGVTVRLLDSSGNELNITTTATKDAKKGYYEFCDLDINSEYKVEFDVNDTYEISPKDQGGDDSSDSDADESTKVATATVAVDDNMTIDAGIYESACLGDYVWYDKNKDGIQDSNEDGVDGVTVKLLDSTGTELNSTTTASKDGKKGYYEFCELKPDSYKVKFIQPDGYEGFTTKDAGDGTNDSDADENGDIDSAVTLKSGEFNHDLDAGLTKPPSSIDIEKFTQDREGNFQQADSIDDNDVPTLIEGHKVTWKYIITNTGGQSLSSVTVSDDKAGQPDSCVDENNETVALPATLASGDSITCYKDGVVQDASKGDYENNATVSAKDSDFENVTDSDLSHYKVVAPACIGNRIWLDTNANGIQDDSESNLNESITVTLLDANGNSVKDANDSSVEPIVTSDGKYEFCNLVPDDYKVKFTLPNGYYFSPKDKSGSEDDEGADNTDDDSDVDSATGETVVVHLDSGENDPTWDAGVFKPACIGDYIWLDKNANGIQESGESGIEGITVELFDSNDNSVNDANATAVVAQETNSTGGYEFCNLVPGDYYIKVTVPSEYRVSPQDVSSKADDANDVNSDSDIDPTTGKTVVAHLDSGEKDERWDAGLYKTVCLGDIIWEDKNANGIQDTDEQPIKDVKVELLDSNSVSVIDANGTTVDAHTTAEDGNYTFCNLVPGSYKIKVTPPEGYRASKPFQGEDESKDSNIDPTTQESKTETLESGENNYTVDGGIYKSICIGDYIWYDKSADGIQDADESGIKDVELQVSDEDGLVTVGADGKAYINTTKTDSNGSYQFCNLLPGKEYKVKITNLPEEYSDALLTYNDTTSDDKDSDFNRDSKETPLAVQYDDNMTYDGGVFKPACIGDRVWLDTNANGIQDDGELGVEGVKIELLNEDGTAVTVAADGTAYTNTQDTNKTGGYEFCNLIPNKKYSIKVTPPAGYYLSAKDSGDDDSKDSDIDPNSKTTEPTLLESGENDPTWDAGVFKPACIGDYIWLDKNANGIQESGEAGVAGVELSLVDGSGADVVDVNGSAVVPYITKEDGKYEFCNLTPGEYQVKVVKLPDGYIITRESVGDDSKDSDIDSFLSTSGTMPKETLVSNEHNMTLDGGVFKPACLGDYVWKDKNVNGIQDEDETPISGVHVTINPLKDSFGNSNTIDVEGKPLTTKDTDAEGKYEYCNLIPGSYSVSFSADSDENGAPYITTAQDKGDDSKDSDIEEFKEANGTTPAVVLVSGDDNRTLDAGYIQELCLGDYVWEDRNANGIQEASETPLSDVEVNLYMRDGDSWVQAKDVEGNTVKASISDSKGNYKFCHLTPAKDYKIVFNTPKGYYVTDKDTTDDSNDSDADSNGEIVVKNALKDDLTLDAGLFRPACIGNYVWEDADADGIQDSNELGVDGVRVELLQNGSSDIVDVDGNVVKAITTSNGGKYHFACKLKPGKYSIKFTAENGDYYFTRKDKDSNDTKDSDVQEEFAHKVGTTKETFLESGEDDISWDAGIFKPACIGDYIWDDLNANGIQDSGELAPKDDSNNTLDIKVELDVINGGRDVDLDGNALNTTIQDSGEYKFCKLIPGSYKVKVTVPKNWYVTKRDIDSNDSTDSDMGEYLDTNKVVEMPEETLTSGENNMTFDGGMFKPSCLGSIVWFDKNANGIKDYGEDGIKDVNITLIPTEDEFGNINDTTADKIAINSLMITTEDDGKYEFCNLIPGKYKVHYKFPLVDGAPIMTTKYNAGDDSRDSDAPAYALGEVTTDPISLESRANSLNVFVGTIQKICLGNKVWFDKNLNGIQDKDELGVRDTEVSLTYADGSEVVDVYGKPVKLTKTDSNGEYSFCNLYPARDYQIKIKLPDGYSTTPKDKGSDDKKDSDTNRDGTIKVFKPTLDNYSLDAGIYCDCDDYKVNPTEHKELKASALNIAGLIALLGTIFAMVRRKD